MSESRKIAKNTIFLSIANTTPRIVQALVIFIAARTIGDVGLGKYYTAASLVALGSLLTDLGMNSLLTREVSTKKDQASKYFFNLFLVKLLLGAISYLFLILMTWALNYSVDVMKAIYVYGVFMSVWALIGLFLALFQSFEEMHYNAWVWGVNAFLNLLISGLLLYFKGDFMSPIWGLSIGAVAALILCFLIAQKKITFSLSYFDWPFLKKNLKLAFPFALNSIFSTIYFRINSIILSKLVTEQVMGWYGSAYKLFDNFTMIPNFFLGAAYPVLCRLHTESTSRFKEAITKSLKVLALGAFPVTLGLALVAEKAILLLYGPDFVNGTTSLQILSFALLCIFFSSLGVISLMSMSRMKVVNLVSFISIFLNVGLSFLLIPSWGLNLSLNGAAIASFVCEFFALVVYVIYFSRLKLIDSSDLKAITKPLIATLAMCILVKLTLQLNIVFNLAIGIATYVSVLYLIKGFTKKEVMLIKGFAKR